MPGTNQPIPTLYNGILSKIGTNAQFEGLHCVIHQRNLLQMLLQSRPHTSLMEDERSFQQVIIR